MSQADIQCTAMQVVVYRFYAFSILVAGCAYLVFPTAMMELAVAYRPENQLLTDIRASYGGFHIALAVFLIAQGVGRTAVKNGFRLLGILLLAVGLVRGIGAFIDGGQQQINIAAATLELATAGIAFYFYRRLNQ